MVSPPTLPDPARAPGLSTRLRDFGDGLSEKRAPALVLAACLCITVAIWGTLRHEENL
jgi:hypothetical protein